MKPLANLFCALCLLVSPLCFGQQNITLREAVRTALASNISLQVQGLDVTQADLTLWQSRYSRLPNLTFSGTQGFNFGRSVDPFTNQFVDQQIRSNNFSLSGSAVLFAGGQINRTIQRNRLSTQSYKYLYQQQRNQLSLTVAQSYLTVVTQKNVLNVAKSQTAISLNQLNKTKRQLDAGVASLNTFYVAESQYFTSKTNEANALNNYQTAVLDLKQLLNFSADNTSVFEDPGVEIVADTTTIYDVASVYEQALTTQPEVQVAQTNKLVGLANEQIARSALFPTLNLSFNTYTGYSSSRTKAVLAQNSNPSYIPILTATGDTFNLPTSLFESSAKSYNTVPYPFGQQLNDNLSRSVTLQLNVPIFSNMRNRLNISTAGINTKKAILNEANTRNQLYKSVWAAVQQYENAKIKYRSLEKALASADRSFQEGLKRGQAGTTNQFELNSQQSLLTQAQVNFEVAKIDLVFKKMVIEFYIKPWNE